MSGTRVGLFFFLLALSISSLAASPFSLIKALFAISGENFHTIIPGQAYRSAQLSYRGLKRKIDKYNIRTIINLRGKQESCRWWQREAALARSRGIVYYNIAMRAQTLPRRKDLIDLIEALKNAPRPLLLHCYGGADRTGEAAALYLQLIHGQSKKRALKQLRSRFGHLSSRYPAKRFLISQLLPSRNIEQWVRQHYYPERYPRYFPTVLPRSY